MNWRQTLVRAGQPKNARPRAVRAVRLRLPSSAARLAYYGELYHAWPTEATSVSQRTQPCHSPTRRRKRVNFTGKARYISKSTVPWGDVKPEHHFSTPSNHFPPLVATNKRELSSHGCHRPSLLLPGRTPRWQWDPASQHKRLRASATYYAISSPKAAIIATAISSPSWRPSS
ncbi:hypothetical protein BDY17DRAFT_195580 [Neohortaea acidophila]|uniref:Uncharacterized protein n=1 Tax=Neohortaea acidophila TaxID=245834 RepID=A0A6A6PKR1_9PEZI|nr:uncharacterized protein BDY17DRAFT_195580 [Neohortaea acidophila]KAF2480609.1 hypothetical protein BDY17DRAFT_195580 [Neohortaea acidophila]